VGRKGAKVLRGSHNWWGTHNGKTKTPKNQALIGWGVLKWGEPPNAAGNVEFRFHKEEKAFPLLTSERNFIPHKKKVTGPKPVGKKGTESPGRG